MLTKTKLWFSKLLNMDDNTVSASTTFLVFTSIIGLLLLLIPSIGLMVDLWYNHTITINLSGLADYIVASGGIFASGGILKGWTNYSNYKYHQKKGNDKPLDLYN